MWCQRPRGLGTETKSSSAPGWKEAWDEGQAAPALPQRGNAHSWSMLSWALCSPYHTQAAGSGLGDQRWQTCCRVHRLHEHSHWKGSCCLPALAFRVPTRVSEDRQMVARQPILWIEIRTSALPTSQGWKDCASHQRSSRVYDNLQTQHRKKEPCCGRRSASRVVKKGSASQPPSSLTNLLSRQPFLFWQEIPLLLCPSLFSQDNSIIVGEMSLRTASVPKCLCPGSLVMILPSIISISLHLAGHCWDLTSSSSSSPIPSYCGLCWGSSQGAVAKAVSICNSYFILILFFSTSSWSLSSLMWQRRRSFLQHSTPLFMGYEPRKSRKESRDYWRKDGN